MNPHGGFIYLLKTYGGCWDFILWRYLVVLPRCSYFSLNIPDCVGSFILRTECLGCLTPVEDFVFFRTLQKTFGVYPLQCLDCLTPLEGNVPLTRPDRVGG